MRYIGGDVSISGGADSLIVTASNARNVNVPLKLPRGVNASDLDFSITAHGVSGDAAGDLKTKTGLDFNKTGINKGRITGTPSVVLTTPTRYTIKARGKAGTIYEGAAPVTAEITLRVNAAALRFMSYTGKSVLRGGTNAQRTISVSLSGGLAAALADYTFEPASSKPSWLNLSSTGTISGTVPAASASVTAAATYTIKVTGKGIYAGKTRNVNFVLRVVDEVLDFDLSSSSSPDPGGGMWSDGTTLWISNNGSKKLYAFNLSTKVRDSSKDFTVGVYSKDIWSDGTTLWVLGHGMNGSPDFEIYAYSMSTRARDSGKEFTTLKAAGNNRPTSIWSDGTTMWVADEGNGSNDKIYAYSMSTKARDSGKDFSSTALNAAAADGNIEITGIWSDGTTMWVGDIGNSNIWAYSLSTRQRTPWR